MAGALAGWFRAGVGGGAKRAGVAGVAALPAGCSRAGVAAVAGVAGVAGVAESVFVELFSYNECYNLQHSHNGVWCVEEK